MRGACVGQTDFELVREVMKFAAGSYSF